MERKEELLRKFGRKLTLLRKQKGLSVRELAVAAGLNPDQVKKIEAGKANFFLSTLVALAMGLEMLPEELLSTL
jgi:transcriptional regulator with XRE-family HTH domain